MVKTRKKLRPEIDDLVNKLPIMYPELNLQNHCYRRIAYDMACGEKWSDKYLVNFVDHASMQELSMVVYYLNKYLKDKNSLITDNAKSLQYRK